MFVIYFYCCILLTQSLKRFDLCNKFNNVAEMSEWSNVSVSKTDVPQGTEGSNPPLSASKKAGCFNLLFYFFVTFSFRDLHPTGSTPVGARPHIKCSRLRLQTCHRQLCLTRRPSCSANNKTGCNLTVCFLLILFFILDNNGWH